MWKHENSKLSKEVADSSSLPAGAWFQPVNFSECFLIFRFKDWGSTVIIYRIKIHRQSVSRSVPEAFANTATINRSVDQSNPYWPKSNFIRCWRASSRPQQRFLIANNVTTFAENSTLLALGQVCMKLLDSWKKRSGRHFVYCSLCSLTSLTWSSANSFYILATIWAVLLYS